MKKNNSILFIILFAICCLNQSYVYTYAQTHGNQFYEAETARNNGLLLLEDLTASSGRFLRMRDSGSITWNVVADTSSWYELAFRYRAPGGEKEEYIIRNGYRYAVGFGGSDDWNYFKTQTYLHKGANTIELKESWGNIDIDCLGTAPVRIDPVIKPSHNIYYRESPRDLFFKVNCYGRHILSITCGAHNLLFEVSDFPDYEDAVILRIPWEEVIRLDNGNNVLQLHFDGNYSGEVSLQLVAAGKPAGLTIIVPHIDHGASVLMILPTKKILLVDSGQDWARDSIIIPLIRHLGIDTIDYFMITHYHEDHDSRDSGKKIIDLFHVDKFWDYHSFDAGDEFELEGTRVKILNSYKDGEDENTRSLSFRMEYNGFVYLHGGDTYHTNQRIMMKRFPNDIEAEVLYANHHFHGSVDVDYLRAVNPAIVLLQSQSAIYARSAYMEKFKKDTEEYLIRNRKRYIEDLPALEVGTVIVRVHSKSLWTYETSKIVTDNIPFLFN